MRNMTLNRLGSLESERLAKSSKKMKRKAPAPAIAVPKPAVRVHVAQGKVSVKRRSRKQTLATSLLVTYGAFTVLAYFVSTLCGVTLMEQARQQARHSRLRAYSARQDVDLAQVRLQRLMAESDLVGWAKRFGFVPFGYQNEQTQAQKNSTQAKLAAANPTPKPTINVR